MLAEDWLHSPRRAAIYVNVSINIMDLNVVFFRVTGPADCVHSYRQRTLQNLDIDFFFLSCVFCFQCDFLFLSYCYPFPLGFYCASDCPHIFRLAIHFETNWKQPKLESMFDTKSNHSFRGAVSASRFQCLLACFVGN